MRPNKTLILAVILFGLCGCAHDYAAIGPETAVIALPNNHTAALTSDDIVIVMRQAGFTDEQILDLGTDLRNRLASSGAAQIRLKKKIQAIFALQEGYLHVASRLRGSFIYDLKTGSIK